MCVCVSLKKKFLHYPTHDEFIQISQGFKDTWGFPQCVGAIDSTHIPILAPSSHCNDYYNRKGWYSVICQAIVDHKYHFWDLYIGQPGKVHDARVFANSPIAQACFEGSLFPQHIETLAGVDVPLVVVGDAAYPLQPFLLKPFADRVGIGAQEKLFNYRLSRARMTVECAFGRLKGRWRALLKRNDTHISMVPHLVLCCGILHNICEHRGDFIEEDLENHDLPQPRERTHHDDDLPRDALRNRAVTIRNAIAEYLAMNV